jgi:hypothetical protein
LAARPICYGLGPRRQGCLIDASNAADASLRTRYEQAARAGVPNFVLNQYRRAWTALRRYGGSDPERMILGYRRLASDLNAEMGKARPVYDRDLRREGPFFP